MPFDERKVSDMLEPAFYEVESLTSLLSAFLS